MVYLSKVIGLCWISLWTVLSNDLIDTVVHAYKFPNHRLKCGIYRIEMLKNEFQIFMRLIFFFVESISQLIQHFDKLIHVKICVQNLSQKKSITDPTQTIRDPT